MMAKQKTLYTNEEWLYFSLKVRKRDGNMCLNCFRPSTEVVLQVHHEKYIPNKKPWEYPLSDCITLCRGCHAREHGLIEPNSGWFLISIDDLGGLYGTCERANCGADIRYEHLTYHPEWGYKTVGSTCIEHLTQKDKKLSGKILTCYRNISSFVHKSSWENGTTKANKAYIGTTHAHDLIRIYGSENRYAFQVALKERGRRFYNYQDVVGVHGKSLLETKELAYIMLKGLTTKSDEEKTMLRKLYKNIM